MLENTGNKSPKEQIDNLSTNIMRLRGIMKKGNQQPSILREDGDALLESFADEESKEGDSRINTVQKESADLSNLVLSIATALNHTSMSHVQPGLRGRIEQLITDVNNEDHAYHTWEIPNKDILTQAVINLANRSKTLTNPITDKQMETDQTILRIDRDEQIDERLPAAPTSRFSPEKIGIGSGIVGFVLGFAIALGKGAGMLISAPIALLAGVVVGLVMCSIVKRSRGREGELLAGISTQNPGRDI